MSDSATIGFLAISALALASEAAKRGILGENTRIVYHRLEEKIAAWSNSDAAALADVYMPGARRRRLVSTIEALSPDDRVKIKSMASALVESLRADVLRGSLGISLRQLEELRVQLTTIAVAQ
jgi:hypothetical protein